MKSDFRASMVSGVYHAIYDDDGNLLKLYETTQLGEYDTWAETGPPHTSVLEDAFRWPVGMLVEVWDEYVYTGTFKVVEGNTQRHLREIEGAKPVGSEAFTHPEFSVREPNLRYRRLLDPNWQCSLTERSRQWRRETNHAYYAVGMVKGGLPVSDKVYSFWGYKG